MGSRDGGAVASGTVTFLFTDIEGSTRRWEADADAMREALAEHDAVLRDAIESHGGWMFKHTGDGVCAAFQTARAAVDAAVAGQRSVGLPVRMGIATGEAEMRGDDYFGPVLNQAARVMSAGHGGQILVAESTTLLVASMEALDLGERRLRDLVESVRVFQVVAPGLSLEFPPLRKLDPVLGNLPITLASFVGRSREADEVAAAIRSHPLVTLTGVGGVGKTRLALHVASELAAEFPDGVWLAELAEVGDPEAVSDAVATALAITPQPAMSMTDTVAQGLAGRRVLLVLDNCEHVLDGAGDLIEAIFEASTTPRVLVTSREGTGVPGEQVWTVPSLDVRSGVASDAVGLFVARAREVDATFAIDDEDDETAVVEICDRLDGIALAIELAAARMASMTPGEVCERVGDRFRLLSGGRRGLERHQTLRHTVQWSFDLLEEHERAVLRRCAVFAGGFDLTAALEVAGGGEMDEYRMLDELDSLARKSLLVVDSERGRTRYTMLETIRQFAEEQLVGVDEHENVRSRHARYFARGVAHNFELWASADQGQAYEWYDSELANLRAAFRSALQAGDLDSAATIAGKASYPAAFHNWFEPAEWCVELIETPDFDQHRLLKWVYVGAAQLTYVGSAAQAVSSAQAGLELDDDRYERVPHEIERCSLGIATMFNGALDRWVSVSYTHLEPTRLDLASRMPSSA